MPKIFKMLERELQSELQGAKEELPGFADNSSAGQQSLQATSKEFESNLYRVAQEINLSL